MEMAKTEPKLARKTPLAPPVKTKSTSRPAEDREKIIKRLLADVHEYYEKFNKPCQIKALSAKYSRALRGDFYDVINDLTLKNEITVELLSSAARVVYPGNVEIKKFARRQRK